MNGLLSDKTRDTIAIIGLLLAIIQTIIALASIRFKIARPKIPTQLSGIGRRLFNKFNAKNLEDSLSAGIIIIIVVFIILTIVVFVGSSLIYPSYKNDALTPSEELIYVGLLFFIAVQFFLLIAILALIEDFLCKISEEIERFIYLNPLSSLIHGGIFLLMLFIAIVNRSYVSSEASWTQLALHLYINEALVWSVIGLLLTTIEGIDNYKDARSKH
jgi:Na+-transporting NADH:ubiquinone oxidoreductase subunit NqrE